MRERKKNLVKIVTHFFVKYITLILGNIKFNNMLKTTLKNSLLRYIILKL